jgi:hypothetical protein
VHVYDAYRLKEATPIIHAATIKAKGAWIPVAWPHDGLQHDKGSGDALAAQYRNLGVNMLKEKATHAPAKGEEEGTGGQRSRSRADGNAGPHADRPAESRPPPERLV